MRRCHSLVVVLVVLFGLGGCATVPKVDPERNQVIDSLAYFHRISTAPADIQRKEYADANVAFELSPDEKTRLRLALMLMVPGTPWRDDARASLLLGAMEVPAGDQVSTRRDLVFLLEKAIQSRRDDQRKCDQRLESAREERRKIEQKAEAVREECKRADVLQQKLDELRDIDRDLRNKRPVRRTKP
jgi:hypothetical protein